MNLSDFSFTLPEELIAQEPLQERSDSRLLVLNREKKTIEHKIFKDIIDYLDEGDCLVLNNTRVIPARLIGEKLNTQSKMEFLLLKRLVNDQWEVMVKPGKRAQVNSQFLFGNGLLKATVLEIIEDGNRIVQFEYEGIFEEVLDALGEMPLPPYITHKLTDKERYQTVYSKHKGSAAAPTAGLHFTPELMNRIAQKGINIAYVTLHVGLGTFRPVKVDNIKEHNMHSEYFWIDGDQAKIINQAKLRGRKIVAVGTTSSRVLESVGNDQGLVEETKGNTSIFIYPGYKFKVVDALITNFHLPESTLMMLVSAFADREFILKAYQEAIDEKYRFFSFGDAMLIK